MNTTHINSTQTKINHGEKSDNLSQDRLYEEFGPSVYGLISNLIDDENLVDSIFVEVFTLLNSKINFSTNTHSCPFILRFAYKHAIARIEQNGSILRSFSAANENLLIHLFCTKYDSVQNAMGVLNINESEARQRIRLEFNKIRSGKSETV